jgi:hypothetical protein
MMHGEARALLSLVLIALDEMTHPKRCSARKRRTSVGNSRSLGALLTVVVLLVASRAGAQERSIQGVPSAAHSPLVEGLDGLVGGFFDGFLDSIERAARLSVIARDWDAAQLLLGHLSPIDEVLRERSKRMVLMRRRLADGPLVPFLQLGLGQWRIDPDMPAIPHDVVLAGQLGGGLELHLTRLASVAAEAECTVINPARSEALWIRSSTLWGSFLAARVKF